MRYYIAVFKSRSQVMNFANLLRANNIPCAIVNTPSNLGKTCGLSVKFLEDYFARVQNILRRNNFRSFEGFYEITNNYYGNNVKKI